MEGTLTQIVIVWEKTLLTSDKPKPIKVVPSPSVSKKIIACFFKKTSHVTIVALEDRTVNDVWYT